MRGHLLTGSSLARCLCPCMCNHMLNSLEETATCSAYIAHKSIVWQSWHCHDLDSYVNCRLTKVWHLISPSIYLHQIGQTPTWKTLSLHSPGMLRHRAPSNPPLPPSTKPLFRWVSLVPSSMEAPLVNRGKIVVKQKLILSPKQNTIK